MTPMTWRDRPVRVRVPATSANLGPGFDSLGLALGLHNVVAAEATSGGLQIEVSGFGEQSASYGESHLVVRSMRAAFDRLGEQPPGIALRCDNAIPQGFGLGSSAAAITAGLLAARALYGERGRGRLPDPAVLHLAADLEGHADNVAACQAGGLTIAWAAGGSVRSTKLEPLSDLMPVLCVPAEPLATKTARQALPDTVPHADAVSNAARAALLVAALTGDPRDLFDATEDFLHQSYRASSMPGSASLLGALRAASVPAVLSGAGPAVLALLVPPVTPAPDIVTAIAAATGEQWMVSVLDVDRQGAMVLTGDDPIG
jgi:homoserine kinase